MYISAYLLSTPFTSRLVDHWSGQQETSVTNRYWTIDILDIRFFHQNLFGLDTEIFYCCFRDDFASFQLFYLPVELANPVFAYK